MKTFASLLHSPSALCQAIVACAMMFWLLLLPQPTRGACPIETAVWSENFEVEGWPTGWTTAGFWESGEPTNPGGPGAAHEGLYCAAIGLRANHPDSFSASLYSPRLTVPAATHNPRLRFWHWFSINAGGACNQPGDHAKVYVL